MITGWEKEPLSQSALNPDAPAPPRNFSALTDMQPTLSSPIRSATIANDVTIIMELPQPMMIVGAYMTFLWDCGVK